VRFFAMKNLIKVSALSALNRKSGLFGNSLVSADTSKSIGTVSALSALKLSALSALGVPIPVPIKIRVTFYKHTTYS
jgi:hypothetical protein